MNFHVHETEYDPDANHNAYVANPEEIRTNCSGDSCFWDDNCHCWDWFLGGEVVLEAEYNHGFLDSTTEPFWVCGEVTVWESTDASDDSAIILEDILCKTDLVTDPADASDPSGYITVYTDLRDV